MRLVLPLTLKQALTQLTSIYGIVNKLASVEGAVAGVGSGERLVSEPLLCNCTSKTDKPWLNGANSLRAFRVCIGNMKNRTTGCFKKPSIWLRLRQLVASLSASTDSQSDGVFHPDTEVDPDMQRGASAGWADAPASILVPIVSALGSHQHCTCCLVCQRWLHLLSEFWCLLSAMFTRTLAAAIGWPSAASHLVPAHQLLLMNRLSDVLPCTGSDVQHLWVKSDRDAAQTRKLLHCYSNLSSLNLSNSTCLQTTVLGLTAFSHIQDLRVSVDSSADLNALTCLPHLLELSIHCNYSLGTEPTHFQLERLVDLRLFRLHGSRSVLGSTITNSKLLTLELSQCPSTECLTACTWLTKLSVWSPPAEDSLLSLVNLRSLQFPVGGTHQDEAIQAFPTDFFSPFTALTTLWMEGLLDDFLLKAVSQAAGLTQLVVFRSPQCKAERTCQKASLQHLCNLHRLQKLRCKFLCVESRPQDESEDDSRENRMLYAATLAETADRSPHVLSETGYHTKIKITQVGWWGT